MPLRIKCPGCQSLMDLPDDAAGKQFRCGKCQRVFSVGGGTPAAPPPSGPMAVPPPAGPSASGGMPKVAVAPAPAPAPAPAASPPRPPEPVRAASSGCPACGASLPEGAISCMDCGFMLQADAAGDAEGAPVLCPNPACGVANSPGARNCVRCSSLLPHPPGYVVAGRYKIDKLLAQGGFGAVYLASDSKSGDRKVAIKDMICEDPQEFAIRLNFFRREAEILRSLEKVPIVPRIYDLIEQGQTAQLVMEFIPGRDLMKIMEDNSHQPFRVEQVLEWGQAICDVLEVMHTQQPSLVHRDLKPDNVMLLQDGRSIKMIDFGTARDLGRTAAEKQKAKTRVFTEGYAPMEQMAGKPEPRSDLFALAGTMYHLATGKAPEGSFTAKELEGKLADGSVPESERWFYELIKVNLAEDVNDRYFTAREVRGDLQKRAVTVQVGCPKCQAVNPVREPYCAKCAEPLTDRTPPCHNCGQENHMGSRFCVHCGNRLR